MTVYEIVTLVAASSSVVCGIVLAVLTRLIKQEVQRLIDMWNGLATIMKSNDYGGQNFSDAKEETDDL